MLAQRLIERKRDGGRLEPGEWRALTLAYTAGHVPDYQMAAFLMACFLRGLDREETSALTEAMLDSGNRLTLADLGLPRVDKHSTGGVGDKVSLVLAPLIASLGVAVPMMSGRGLGHTGGTLDKLELAEAMIRLGSDHDCPVVALVTAMDRPLGRACGNALEVEEAIATLKGEGPPDLLEVTYALGVEMLLIAGVANTADDARRQMEKAIGTGKAAERFESIIEAQGG